MKEFLNNIARDKLLDFLEEYAANDDKFANAVNVRFGKPEFKKELAKLEKAIDNALDGASDYRRRGGWGYIDVDTNNIVDEIQERAEQGHIRLAFAQAEMLYRKLLEVFEYQDECEIADEAEDCIRIMDWIADIAVTDGSAEDKQYIFETCIRLADIEDGKDYGADYEDKLLRISAKFVTPENRAELEKAVAFFDKEWRTEGFKLIRYDIISRVDGENAADDFIAENLRFPKIREIAFDKAVSRENYPEAAKLCIDALAMSEIKPRYSFGISPWLYKLYSVYEMMENTTEMAKTAEKILLCGDLKYYDILKKLREKQGVWDDLYLELLNKCEAELSYMRYMEILEKEKEYALLFEQLKKYPEQIYIYGNLLSKKYLLEISVIFAGQINKESETAYGRESYNKVCSHIICFAEAGYKAEAAEMIDDFKLKYKRKPAFVDELVKISY